MSSVPSWRRSCIVPHDAKTLFSETFVYTTVLGCGGGSGCGRSVGGVCIDFCEFRSDGTGEGCGVLSHTDVMPVLLVGTSPSNTSSTRLISMKFNRGGSDVRVVSSRTDLAISSPGSTAWQRRIHTITISAGKCHGSSDDDDLVGSVCAFSTTLRSDAISFNTSDTATMPACTSSVSKNTVPLALSLTSATASSTMNGTQGSTIISWISRAAVGSLEIVASSDTYMAVFLWNRHDCSRTSVTRMSPVPEATHSEKAATKSLWKISRVCSVTLLRMPLTRRCEITRGSADAVEEVGSCDINK
eukprot:PhM_4_TR2016/c0_g1_i1/m.18969